MMDFLSDVFEFEVDPEQDLVINDGLNLKLIELPEDEKENFKSLGIKFAFKLKEKEQIQEIKSKYNFFLYRKSDQKISEEIASESEDEKSLSIKDIDGRIWQFDVETMQ
ncbi:hypothetical protein C0V70_09575 [Bacteriovorax stolpii]|uniref:Uncharacterized protein n=1 Tax=Bacteriovorax stolpii TaxID=960 RepID=A0A2K9NS53_BACTC|nr:hypothetical protein [Bacteriovorax stolpii]AUN98350.1 hypothetical protein C0V70_09575 [Bacteriovorax stolpii]TDP52274.1 hypothetical protein C8D79_2925 [Bacteriovorax stolpii]